MAPDHANPDCPGVWRHHVKEQEFRCSHCRIRHSVTPEVWREVQEDHTLRNVITLAARDGERILEEERRSGERWWEEGEQ